MFHDPDGHEVRFYTNQHHTQTDPENVRGHRRRGQDREAPRRRPRREVTEEAIARPGSVSPRADVRLTERPDQPLSARGGL
jgi:hypothetical protein